MHRNHIITMYYIKLTREFDAVIRNAFFNGFFVTCKGNIHAVFCRSRGGTLYYFKRRIISAEGIYNYPHF